MWDIITAIISGIVLLIIEKFLLTKNNGNVNVNIIEPQRVIKSEKILVKEKVVYVDQQRKDESSDGLIWLMLFLLMFITTWYIKYSYIFHSIIIIVSIAVGIMALGMEVFCMRRGMTFKKPLNLVLIFNILALVIVPWIVNLTIKTSKENGIDIKKIKQEVELGKGFGSADIFDIFFLMYQIIGLFFVIIYMFCTLISNLYLISLININLNSKWGRMWSFINEKTYRLMSKPIAIVVIEAVCLIIGYLFVSGVFLNLITK